MPTPHDGASEGARREDAPERPHQDAFTHAVLDPAAPTPAVLATRNGAPPTRRFGVYRNNVVVSLVRALGDAYPAVKALVGERFFDAMAVEHVRAHPPCTPVMCLYGEAFPPWLERFPPTATLPYLPGVARLERARLEAHHAPDAEALSPEAVEAELAARPPEALEALRLTLHPSLRASACAYPALAIWARALGHDAGEGPLPAGAETVFTVRPELETTSFAAQRGAEIFLAALAQGARLGEAAERAGDGFDLVAALGLLFRRRCVVVIT